MRHPRAYKFLCFAGPAVLLFAGSCIGLVVAAAQRWEGVARWAELRFYEVWPIVTAWWFLVAACIVIVLYLAALIYTSSPTASVNDTTGPSTNDGRVPNGPTFVDTIIQAKHESNRAVASAKSHLHGGRDTQIANALSYALSGNWDGNIGMGLIFSRNGLRALEKPLVRFRKAASSGELRVWGKRDSTDLFELIDPSFWLSSTLEPASLISMMSVARTQCFDGAVTVEQFHDIMVNRFEVERVWPHAG
jgi:hypothetical protein